MAVTSRWIFAAALVALPMIAAAQDMPPPGPGMMEHRTVTGFGGGSGAGCDRPWMISHEQRFLPGGMHELRAVDLSRPQREAIRKVFEDQHRRFEALGRTMRDERQALRNLDPRSADYEKRVRALAERAADLARRRVTLMAEIRRQVDAQLTDAQHARLRQMRRQAAERRAEALQHAADRARREAQALQAN